VTEALLFFTILN